MDIEQARQLRNHFLPSARILVETAVVARRAPDTDGVIRPIEKSRDVLSMGIARSASTDTFTVAVRATSDTADLRDLVARIQAESDLPVDLEIIRPPTPRQGALTMGASIGHPAITAGTLGAFVRDNNGVLGILSNNHVLADSNSARLGDPILHPGPIDGGQLTDQFATLANFVPLDSVGPNYVDAAYARLDSPVAPSSHPSGPRVTGHFVEATALMEVFKAGRTTSATQGVISAVELIGLSFEFTPVLSCTFDNQIEVKSPIAIPFSAGGDSGSLVLALNGDAVGLLFGGTTSQDGASDLTYINPIGPVLTALGITLART